MDPFIGQIVMFGGHFAPRGWALCNGQLLAIASNTALFSILGTTYGGDGRTTFGLPDLRGRVPMHAGHGPGLSDRRLGQKFGVETMTLTQAEMPSHTHTAAMQASGGTASSTSPAGMLLATPEDVEIYGSGDPVSGPTITVGNAGGSQAFNVIQPTQVVNYIIALQGIYPSRS